MSKRNAALVAAVSFLLLAGCSDDSAEVPETVTVTSTVATTPRSDEEKIREMFDVINPENQLTAANLSAQCIMAIDDYLRDSGNFDFPEPILLKPTTPEKTAYAGGGPFRYQDSQDVWKDATYYCRVHADGQTITDAYASVSSL